MNDTVAQALAAGVLPAGLGGAAGAFFGARGMRRCAAICSIAVAPMACQALLEGMPSERWHAVAALPAGALAAVLASPMVCAARWRAVLTTLLIASAATFVQLRITTLEDPPLLRWGPVLFAVLLAAAGACRAATRADSIVVALALGSATGMALVAGFLRLAVITAAAGCALGIAGIVLQLRKSVLAPGGLAMLGIPSLAVAPMVGRAYVVDDALPVAAFLLPAIIPIVALGADALVARRRPFVRGALVIAVTLLIAAAIPLVVHRASGGTPSTDPYEDMYNEMMPTEEDNG